MNPGIDVPKKPVCAVAYVLAAIASIKLLNELPWPDERLLQSLLGKGKVEGGSTLLFPTEDVERALYGFTLLLGVAVLAELIDRIRWTLAGGAGPLKQTYLAPWVAHVLRRLRTLTQVDVELKP